ncbi:hypothetical protein AB0C96_40940 [Streptomyces sp. NPDC048506]|uniref:hypothetical protein n=1 Tax=Streptomyces sp. NPDC048506 TaxID=3155028 RepID=UPI003439089C
MAPLDEAYVAHADRLSGLAHEILRDFPLKPRTLQPKGEILQDALELRRLVDHVVASAVIAEIERGASWTDIGNAVGITKQSANERWGDVVRTWTLIEKRRASRSRGGAATARALDDWYAELYPDEPHAITDGLRSADPAQGIPAAQIASANRSAARLLHARLQELKKENTAAFDASFTAIGTPVLKAERQRWANTHIAQADIYEQLAVAEPTIAGDHRTNAAEQRRLAMLILRPPALAEEETNR